MNATEQSECWGCLLGNHSLGVNETVLLNGENVGVRPQGFDLGLREGTSETINDVPLMSDGRGIEGVDISLAASTFLEDDNVSSCNRLPGLLHLDKGRRGGESGENAESEDDEVLDEHSWGCGRGGEVFGWPGWGAPLKVQRVFMGFSGGMRVGMVDLKSRTRRQRVETGNAPRGNIKRPDNSVEESVGAWKAPGSQHDLMALIGVYCGPE